MNQNKLKPLLRKMSYKTLVSECKREHWGIPFAGELKGKDLIHKEVWVSNEVEDEHYTEEDRKYGVQLGYIFDVSKQKKVIVNKKFMNDCIILKRG